MNRRVRRGLAAALAAVWICVLAPAAPLRAQGGEVSASECCLPLLFTIGGRALGLGNATTARTATGGLFVNPALIAGLADDQFIIHKADTEIEKTTTLSVIVVSEVAGTFGVTYRLIDYGDQDAIDENGIPTGSFGTAAHVLTATYATDVFAGLNAGVSYKLYNFRQDCRGFCGSNVGFSATTHGLDLGAQYAPPALPPLRLGAAITHLGFPLQVVNREQASPMPARLRIGAAYEAGHHVMADSAFAVWASADLEISPKNGRTHLNVGVDVSVEEAVFLRGGYGGGGNGLSSGLAAGVGVRFDRFEVDIAKSFASSPIPGDEAIQFSFAIKF